MTKKFLFSFVSILAMSINLSAAEFSIHQWNKFLVAPKKFLELSQTDRDAWLEWAKTTLKFREAEIEQLKKAVQLELSNSLMQKVIDGKSVSPTEALSLSGNVLVSNLWLASLVATLNKDEHAPTEVQKSVYHIAYALNGPSGILKLYTDPKLDKKLKDKLLEFVVEILPEIEKRKDEKDTVYRQRQLDASFNLLVLLEDSDQNTHEFLSVIDRLTDYYAEDRAKRVHVGDLLARYIKKYDTTGNLSSRLADCKNAVSKLATALDQPAR